MDDNNFSKNDLDFLLFEHLEGNLSDDISADLIRKSTIDISIEEELNSWKGAYIDQEYYDTNLLEEKLYHIPSEIYRNVKTNTFFLTLATLTVILNFVPLSLKNDSSEISNQSSKLELILTSDPDETRGLNDASSNTIKTVDNAETIVEIPAEASIEMGEKEKRLRHEIIALEPLQIDETDYAKDIGVKIDFISKPVAETRADKSVNRPSISLKTKRAVEKSKEKALQQRRAMDFMRGNEPYVVPLNSNF